MNIKEFYAAIGVNSDEPLRRFGGSEALLRKFLKKVLDDQTFASLSAAVAVGDREQAFRASHTLKGIALNLELTPLAQLSSQLTELLRGVGPFPDGAESLFGQLSAHYSAILEALRALD